MRCSRDWRAIQPGRAGGDLRAIHAARASRRATLLHCRGDGGSGAGRRGTPGHSEAYGAQAQRVENAYRSTQLLGGDSRFVLSTSGHIQALVNPPGADSRSSYRVAELTRRARGMGRAGGDAARELVARLRPVAGRALGRAQAGAQAARQRRATRRRPRRPAATSTRAETMTATPCPTQHLGDALATDYFRVREQFTRRAVGALHRHAPVRRRRGAARRSTSTGRRAELPWPLMRRLAELGLYGEDIEGYGCPGMSPLARGLVNMELHRGDGSLGTFLGVQSGLAMKSIALLGSEEQKERWLPAMARLEHDRRVRADRARPRLRLGRAGDDARAATGTAGCSTAPSAGSATARSPTSWSSGRATSEDGQVKGFLVEKDSPASRRRRSTARARRARSGRPRSARRRARSESSGCPARTRSRTPAACSSPRARRAPGARSATPSPPTTPR